MTLSSWESRLLAAMLLVAMPGATSSVLATSALMTFLTQEVYRKLGTSSDTNAPSERQTSAHAGQSKTSLLLCAYL